MKAKITRADYARLEKIYPLKRLTFKSILWIYLQNIWHGLSQSSELKVWRRANYQGKILWNAEDKKTGKSIYGLTEQEMRVWIEHKYRS